MGKETALKSEVESGSTSGVDVGNMIFFELLNDTVSDSESEDEGTEELIRHQLENELNPLVQLSTLISENTTDNND